MSRADVPQLQAAIEIYRQEANVRIVPAGPFVYTSAFAADGQASVDWIHGTGRGPSGSGVLDVSCDTPAAGEDLSSIGSNFEILASTACFYTNFRRVIGYGAPVVVFVIRTIRGSQLGCSLGPLSDYVVVEASNPICIAHELGHACNLWHVSDNDNLMNPSCGRRKLGWWQVALVRASRHVTYF